MNAFDFETWLAEALREDIGPGDFTTLATIPDNDIGKAQLIVKDNGVLAGVSIAEKIIHAFDPSLKMTTLLQDGALVQKGDIAFYVEGKSQSITTIERLVLNVMQRMSGIATETHRLTQMIAHTSCKLLDTRKTTPNFRYFEKEAVRIGGGINHRYALYDMILVKDNHIDFSGGVKPALSKIESFLKEQNLDLKIEVETRNLKEIDEVLETGIAFRIMLDNFSPDQIREAVQHINGRVETEASGGINENTLVSYAETGVNYISMGALTHHVKSFDLSLKAIK
ncbi:MAG: carboxylating nicotinate-nucleotide diphosphorylase [Bacteroidota bacterium]|jgi:nicotinate-nucleotide pyrophosphorylase (carboxylating)